MLLRPRRPRHLRWPSFSIPRCRRLEKSPLSCPQQGHRVKNDVHKKVFFNNNWRACPGTFQKRKRPHNYLRFFQQGHREKNWPTIPCLLYHDTFFGGRRLTSHLTFHLFLTLRTHDGYFIKLCQSSIKNLLIMFSTENA